MDIGGTGKVGHHLAIDEVSRNAIDFPDLDAAVTVFGLAVPGESIAGLPIVVVSVEDGPEGIFVWPAVMVFSRT